MLIVQSFAQFEDGYHCVKSDLNNTEIYLHFYSFFLSYILLKKWYGSVTMFCNQLAYDTFIKYIPYDNIVIKENKYNQDYWSAYKLDVIEDIDEDFIHIDSDVLMFKDHLKYYLDNLNRYDLIVQFTDQDNIKMEWDRFTLFRGIYDLNACRIKLTSDKIITDNYSCGVMGMSKKVKDLYIKDTKKVYNLLLKLNIQHNKYITGMLLEEFTLYLTATREKFLCHEIFPPLIDSVHSATFKTMGNIFEKDVYEYTHLWAWRKFMIMNINEIKKIIHESFSSYYHIILDYEKTLKDKDIFIYNNNLKDVIKFIP